MAFLGVTAVLLATGCYDLTFDEDDHVADELRVMAVHLSPAEIRPSEPIDAEVLFADPGRGTRPLWFAWRVFYPLIDGSGETETETFVATDADGGYRFSVTPIPEPAILTGAFFTTFEVFLCAGELNEPSRLTTESTAKLFEELCLGAPLVAASKRAAMVDPAYPQSNPAIDRALLNGEALVSAEDDGTQEMRCRDIGECVAELVVYLTDDSQEPYINRNYNGEAISDELDEALEVEWFVSAGRLTLSVVRTAEWQGPYVTRWYPNAPGLHTLWAIVRDSRGGNSWRTFYVNIVLES